MTSDLTKIFDGYRRPGLGPLKALASFSPPFSPMAALGVASRERSYSAVLRFCLDPAESHGWGDLFLRMFLNASFPERFSEVAEKTLLSARVRTEWKGLDVVIECDGNGPVIGIEVKLCAAERKNQIACYQKTLRKSFSKRICSMVFLTLDGRPPTTALKKSNVACVALSWSRVGQLLGEIRPEDANVPQDVKQFIDDFRNNIVAMTEGDPEERRIVSELFHDQELGQAVLKAARIRYALFTEDVVRRFIDHIERDLGISGLEIFHKRPGMKEKEYGLTFKPGEGLSSVIVFLFYDFPDNPRYGSGMHVLIDGNQNDFDEKSYRLAFSGEDSVEELLSHPPQWGGNWRLALPSKSYPAGTSQGWKFETDSFDDQWLDNAVVCFKEALEEVPRPLLPPPLNHA